MVLLEGFRSGRGLVLLGEGVDLEWPGGGGSSSTVTSRRRFWPATHFMWKHVSGTACQRPTTTTCTNLLIAPQKYRAFAFCMKKKGPSSALVLAQKDCPVSSVSRHILVYFHAALLGPLHRFDSNRSRRSGYLRP